MPYPRYSDSAASGGGSYGGDGYGRRDAYGGQGGQVSKWVFTRILYHFKLKSICTLFFLRPFILAESMADWWCLGIAAHAGTEPAEGRRLHAGREPPWLAPRW